MLDSRFFGGGPSLTLAFGDLDSEATERGEGGISTLDALLATTYSRSQIYLSRQLAQLHPELTMPMFSGTALNPLLILETVISLNQILDHRNYSSAANGSTDRSSAAFPVSTSLAL